MKSNLENEAVRADDLNRFARFLIYANLVLLVLEYFILPSYSKMHGGEQWQNFIRMLLCVVDILAAYAIIRGFIVSGIAAIGGTSFIMFVLPLIADQVTYGWLSAIIYLIMFFWDFMTLIFIRARKKIKGT